MYSLAQSRNAAHNVSPHHNHIQHGDIALGDLVIMRDVWRDKIKWKNE